MYQSIIQDLQQIRAICQQLAQTERQNAQILAQQAGMQNMAQRETFASQQLQQCVNLCNRLQQTVTQAYGGSFPTYQASFAGQPNVGFANQQPAYNPAVFNQMMQGR